MRWVAQAVTATDPAVELLKLGAKLVSERKVPLSLRTHHHQLRLTRPKLRRLAQVLGGFVVWVR
jgi:hypothetical protein